MKSSLGVVLGLLSLGGFSVAYVGCGGGDSGVDTEIEPFKSFAFDTGAIPTGSPVTLDLKASASGKLKLNSAGSMGVDAHVAFAGTMTSTVPGFAYDGPMMGVPNLDIAIVGSTSFPANSIGQPTTLTAPVTPSDLVKAPLAVLLGLPGITGDLDLKVTGGTFTATFTGLCNNDGKYSGSVATGGTITLAGTLNTSVPVIGDKSFDIPTITIPLPALTQVVNLATSDDPAAVGCTGVDGDAGITDTDSGTHSDGGVHDGGSDGGDGGSDGGVAISAANNYQIAIRTIDESTASGLGASTCSGEDSPDPFVTITSTDKDSAAVTGGSGRCTTVKVCNLSATDGLVRLNQNGGLVDTTNTPIKVGGAALLAGTVHIAVWDYDIATNDLLGEGTLPAMSTTSGGTMLMAGPYTSAACTQAAIPVKYEVTPAP